MPQINVGPPCSSADVDLVILLVNLDAWVACVGASAASEICMLPIALSMQANVDTSENSLYICDMADFVSDLTFSSCCKFEESDRPTYQLLKVVVLVSP